MPLEITGMLQMEDMEEKEEMSHTGNFTEEEQEEMDMYILNMVEIYRNIILT